MTGHLDGTGADGNLNVRNNQIRSYCLQNNKILYDFADIESYDPDGLVNYMALHANDNCDYDSDNNGSRDRNWATSWQYTHTQGVDWFSCSAAHSQALNGNRKAYAAWWLWAKIAGWVEKGDVNNDQKVDLADSILALQVSAGIAPSIAIHSSADVNDDQKIGLVEAVFALQTAGTAQ
jgi:hypothetical protein